MVLLDYFECLGWSEEAVDVIQRFHLQMERQSD